MQRSRDGCERDLCKALREAGEAAVKEREGGKGHVVTGGGLCFKI